MVANFCASHFAAFSTFLLTFLPLIGFRPSSQGEVRLDRFKRNNMQEML